MNKDIILIFGGDGKIAQAIVRKYLDLNCLVIAVDKKEKNDNEEFTKNENYHYFSIDITSVDELTDLYNKLHNKFGYVNHIISAAAKVFPTDNNGIYDLSFDDINYSVKLNLIAHIYISKIFLPLLNSSNSSNKSITFISSINALKSLGLPVYSACKSGIFGLVNSSVKVLGKNNIRINSIIPGTVVTHEDIEQKTDIRFYDDNFNALKNMIALENFAFPEDISDSLYSITHITKAITGQNIVIDSGQLS